MVICLERGADLHMAQPMPLPLTVSCFSKVQIGVTFLVPAYLGSPGKGPLNWLCVLCVCVNQAVHVNLVSINESDDDDTCVCISTATIIQAQYRGFHDRQNFLKLKSAGMYLTTCCHDTIQDAV